MPRVFLARFHHVDFSVNVDCSLRNIKIYQHLVLTDIFCCSVCWWWQGHVRQKTAEKSQRRAIVKNFCRSVTDRLVNNKWMTDKKWKMHINDALPLSWAADAILLEVADPPLAGGILINWNNQHLTIRLYLEIFINNSLPLVGAAYAIPLAVSSFLPAGSIWNMATI